MRHRRKVSRVGPIARDQLDLWFPCIVHWSIVELRTRDEVELLIRWSGDEVNSGILFQALGWGLVATLTKFPHSTMARLQTRSSTVVGYGCNHFWLGEVS